LLWTVKGFAIGAHAISIALSVLDALFFVVAWGVLILVDELADT
jgi:hypothetical protein